MVSDLLKKLCSTQEGLQAVCKLPAFLKRLNSLTEDLERKASMEKRSDSKPSFFLCHYFKQIFIVHAY